MEYHILSLNSALGQAKKCRGREHAYIADVIPAHTHKGKNNKPKAIQVFLASLLPPRCCPNSALPLNKTSSQWTQQCSACELHHAVHANGLVMVLIRDGRGEEEVGGPRGFI